MIISVSRRTDIPARYADWFFNRLREGYVCTRNPMNPRQISRISLSPDVVDGFVFWTKNPIPMLDRLSLLQQYPYYFQFTLNAYGTDLEPGVPNKGRFLVPIFRQLAEAIGPQRLVWRYDPIILTPHYTVEAHLPRFRQLAGALSGCSDTCVISFFDSYRHLGASVRSLGLRAPTEAEIHVLAAEMAEIAHRFGFRLMTCAEAIDLSAYGIGHSHCIDADRLGKIGGISLYADKDRSQRAECGCAASIDIGMYNSCGNGCQYCYANHAAAVVQHNITCHDPHSPLLYGTIGPDDRVTERAMHTLSDRQLTLFGK